MRIQINALSDALGAEIVGVDLRRPMHKTNKAKIMAAMVKYIVVAFRDQHLTPAQYVEAMRQFGIPAKQNHTEQLLAEYPEIWVIDSRNSEISPAGETLVFGSNCWHTDHMNQQLPPKFTALYAIRLPPSGGDTLFANAYKLYENLSGATRASIEGMRTVNGADRHLRARKEDADAFAVSAVHPLVRTHPDTGRRALYCHPLKMQYIEGMQPEESFALIDDLLEQALVPDLIYRHQWRPHDLVVIDNRACLHKAARDYDPSVGRVMHRIIVEGERPV